MKVFGLSKLVWSIIFFIVQIFNFAFLVGAMNYDYWFSQELNYYIEGFYYDSYHLQGKLIKPNSNIAQDCTTDNTYQECYDNYSEFGFDALEKWYSAGVAYIFFDTLGAILVVIAAVFIALDAFKFKPLKKIINLFNTAILMFVVAGLHFFAFVIWAGVVKLTFSDCTHNFPYSGAKSVCGEGGAAFAL